MNENESTSIKLRIKYKLILFYNKAIFMSKIHFLIIK